MIETEEQKVVRIQRIQRKFQEGLPFEQKLKYLKYLTDVTISLGILKETSIGKTVNLMRKENGVVGQIAAQLVIKWKEIATSQYGASSVMSNEKHDDEKIDDKRKLDGDSSVQHSINNSREENSSPCKPKTYEEKSKKLNNISSCVNKSKVKRDCISNESLSKETNFNLPLNTAEQKQSIISKEKQKNLGTIEHAICEDSNADGAKKKSKSFEEMLMMPMLPTKSTTRETKEDAICDDDSNTGISKKKSKSFEEMLTMPMLPMRNRNKKIKEEPICNDNLNVDVSKKKSKSFEDMLMMPMLPTKKKNETSEGSFSDEDSIADISEKSESPEGMSMMPMLSKKKKNRERNEGSLSNNSNSGASKKKLLSNDDSNTDASKKKSLSNDDSNTDVSKKKSFEEMLIMPMLTMKKKSRETDDNKSSVTNGDSNTGVPKKKSKSFEEMLMMPMLPAKKKKRVTKEGSNSDYDSNTDIPKNIWKKKRHNEATKERLPPTLPDIELPQVNKTPVYHPSRPAPPSEEIKMKAAPDLPAPTLRFEDITSRKTKSQMYTGKKTCTGVVVSLYQMCMKILIENVDSLYETGGVPFSVLEPLLSKCTPTQLERLEYYNPHFIEDTDGLWKLHCQHTFKGRKIDDDSVAAWRDTYKDLLVEREEKLKRLSSKINANQAAKTPERSAKLAFLASAPKPSAQVLRKQRRFGTGSNEKEKEREREKEKEREKKKKKGKYIDKGVPKGNYKDEDKDKYKSKGDNSDSVSAASSSDESEDEEKKSRDHQKEIRERMMKEQEESSEVHVPFVKVPRRDRCSKRPPSSSQISAPKKRKNEEEELGSVAPSEYTPAPKKKKEKKPMMLKAMKLLKKQKGRMASTIMRR